jgi:hypothetical protein
MEGKLSWTEMFQAQDGGEDNDLLKWTKQSGLCAGVPAESSSSWKVNCWEAVMVAAMNAGVLDAQEFHKVLRNEAAEGLDYVSLMKELLAHGTPLAELEPYSETNPPNRGDVLFFYGMSHVSLSLGGKDTMSLWTQPGPKTNFQKTTTDALLNEIEKDDEEEGLWEQALGGAGANLSKKELSDLAYNLKDNVDLRKETKATDPESLTKIRLRISRNPWEGMNDRLKDWAAQRRKLEEEAEKAWQADK